MPAKNLFLCAVAAAWLLRGETAQACRGPFPEPLPVEEALQRAEAVFLGKLVEIREGFPADFRPADAEEYDQRLRSLKRLNGPGAPPGRILVFAPVTIWKGNIKSTVTLIEPYKQHSCEWNYDMQLEDEFIIFASRYGNYLSMPAPIFDGRSRYTRHNPARRSYTDGQKARHAEKMRREQDMFDEIIRALTAPSAGASGSRHP